MATSAQQRAQRRAATGAAVAGTAATGVAAAAPPAAAAVGSVTATEATAQILGAFVSFLSALRSQHQAALVRDLGRYSSSSSAIAAAVRAEMVLEQEFARRSADRVASALPQILRIADPQEREAKLRGLLEQEQRYASMRAEAMFARAIAALTRDDLRQSSPLGAFWRLGAAQKHTEGCKFMAGHPGRQGRFWPWSVLDRVHPPRHYACTSSLHGYGEAILNGWMSPGDVPDERAALRAASGVVMEAEQASALLTELDVRDALRERGIDTSMIALAGVAEAFDDAKHPRGFHGRFRDTIHGLSWLSRPAVRDVMDERVTAARLGALHVDGGDPFFGRVAADMGFDAKPRVVDKAEMDRLIAGGATEVLRAVAPGPEGPGQYAEAFRKGEMWPGHGVWGSGTYTYAADSRGGKSWLQGQLAKSGGQHPEGLMRIAIPKDTRVIEYGDAYRGIMADKAELDRLIESDPENADAWRRVRDGITTNIGRWAALNGYQAIHVSEEDIYIVLDRSAVAVQSSAESPAVAAAAALKRGEEATIKPEDAAQLVEELDDGSPSAFHKLQVEGHPNLFRAHARELSRGEMPQIPKANLPGFMDFLQSKRVLATVEKVTPSSLQATQNQLNGAGVAEMAKRWDPARQGLMMVSRDGHVLDGHHRWGAMSLYELAHPGYQVDVLRFSVGTDRMLALMHEYNAHAGIERRAFGQKGAAA